ncbi:hypothetical protein ACE6H2_001542 [Prunus campanulata]
MFNFLPGIFFSKTYLFPNSCYLLPVSFCISENADSDFSLIKVIIEITEGGIWHTLHI